MFLLLRHHGDMQLAEVEWSHGLHRTDLKASDFSVAAVRFRKQTGQRAARSLRVRRNSANLHEEVVVAVVVVHLSCTRASNSQLRAALQPSL